MNDGDREILRRREKVGRMETQKAEPGFTELRPEIQNGLVAIAATATAVFTPTTATTARALFTGFGNVDGEGATIHFLAVHGCDGFLRLFGGTHGDETKATRTAGFTVHHQVGFGDRAMRSECVIQVVFGGVEGKVSHKQFTAHMMFYCPRLNFAFARLFPLIGFQIITELGSPEDSPCPERDKLSNRRAQYNWFRQNDNNHRALSFQPIAAHTRGFCGDQPHGDRKTESWKSLLARLQPAFIHV